MRNAAIADFNKRERALQRLREASLETDYVSLGSRRTGSPHEFYRYPGRFPRLSLEQQSRRSLRPVTSWSTPS